jgi:nucleoside phosphorylase
MAIARSVPAERERPRAAEVDAWLVRRRRTCSFDALEGRGRWCRIARDSASMLLEGFRCRHLVNCVGPLSLSEDGALVHQPIEDVPQFIGAEPDERPEVACANPLSDLPQGGQNFRLAILTRKLCETPRNHTLDHVEVAAVLGWQRGIRSGWRTLWLPRSRRKPPVTHLRRRNRSVGTGGFYLWRVPRDSYDSSAWYRRHRDVTFVVFRAHRRRGTGGHGSWRRRVEARCNSRGADPSFRRPRSSRWCTRHELLDAEVGKVRSILEQREHFPQRHVELIFSQQREQQFPALAPEFRDEHKDCLSRCRQGVKLSFANILPAWSGNVRLLQAIARGRPRRLVQDESRTNITWSSSVDFRPVPSRLQRAPNCPNRGRRGTIAGVSTSKFRAVIITALPTERDAVREHLRDVREETHDRGSVYRRGIFDERSEAWDILLAEIGAGNEGAAAEVERAISYFNPDVALFVGVAGAIKDVAHGAVVASTKIYAYESGKDRRKYFETRPSVQLSAYALEQRARHEAGESDWRQRIKGSTPGVPAVTVGPIAAGEKVLASTRTTTFRFIREHYGDALAVEMEGHGFLRGVHMNPAVEGMVIRGISDTIGDKNIHSDLNWQPTAARHAAAFAFQLLAKWAETESRRRSETAHAARRPALASGDSAHLMITDAYAAWYDHAAVPLQERRAQMLTIHLDEAPYRRKNPMEGKRDERAILVNPTLFQSAQTMLDEMYSAYLQHDHAPLSYGAEWILEEIESGRGQQGFRGIHPKRVLAPWGWLIASRPKKLFDLDRMYLSGSPSTLGLVAGSVWRLRSQKEETHAVDKLHRQTYGLAVNNPALLEHVLTGPGKQPHPPLRDGYLILGRLKEFRQVSCRFHLIFIDEWSGRPFARRVLCETEKVFPTP